MSLGAATMCYISYKSPFVYFTKQSEFLNNPHYKQTKIQRYAVIYGAGTIIGKAFAKYLADRSYGLILIDYDDDILKQTEIFLQTKVQRHMNLKLITLKPEKEELDDLKLMQPLHGMSNYCIDLFINASNEPTNIQQRLKKMNGNRQDIGSKGELIMQSELLRKLHKMDCQTFTALIYHFNHMLRSSPTQSLIINVSKVKSKLSDLYSQQSEQSKQICQSFHQSQIQFNNYFSYLMGNVWPLKLRSINAQLDYSSQDNLKYLERQIDAVFRSLNHSQ
ncbi:UNKNOWN [Stylonychia lemnae]|uniref:Uncharacterized protein n=1 Tax=Stylonychia lemnae TaxID=5949 RepID=A0A077ZZP0_STYLE|nr:UNKNOWN [Stylonychia lemnae]|eukprot:CDW75082.1 UNKNOWN [Stylonychia lemnae]